MAARKRLGDLLIESGTIDELQLRSALAHQRQMGGPLGRILVESRFVSEETMVAVLAGQLGLQVVDLDQIAIHPTVLKEVSVDDAESQRILPVRIQQAEARGAILYLATSDPTNVDIIDTIQFRTGKRVIPLLTTESGLERAIRRHYYADVQQTATVVRADVQFAGEEFELDDGGGASGASMGSPATLELDDGIPVVQGAALLEPSPDAWMLGAGNPLHLTSGDAEVGVLSLAEGQLVTGYDEPPSSVALSSADLASLGLHESTDLLDAREALFDFSNAPSRVVVESRPSPNASAPPPAAPPSLATPEPPAPIAPLVPTPPTSTASSFASPPTTLLPLEPGPMVPDATALPLVVATAERTPTPPTTVPSPAMEQASVVAANPSPVEPPRVATVVDDFGPPPPDTGFGVSTSSARFQALLDGLPDGASPRAPGPPTTAPPARTPAQTIAAVAPMPSVASPSTPRQAAPTHVARRERVLDVHDLASLESVEPGLVTTLAAAADDVATLSARGAASRAVAGFAAVRLLRARSVDVDVASIGAMRRTLAGDLLAHDPDAPRAIVPEALHHRLEPATTALDEPTGPSSWLDFAEGQIIANRLSLDDNTDTQSLRLRFMEAKSDEQPAVAPAVTGYVPLAAVPDGDGAPPWAPFSTREASARQKDPTPSSTVVDERPAEIAAPPVIDEVAPEEPVAPLLVEPERSAPLPLEEAMPTAAPFVSTTERFGLAPSAVDVGDLIGEATLAAPEDASIALGGDDRGLAIDDGGIALDARAPTGEVELGAHGGVLDVSSLGLHELSLDEGTGDVPLELDVPSPRAMAPADLDFLGGDGERETEVEQMPEASAEAEPPAWFDAPASSGSSEPVVETVDALVLDVPTLEQPSLDVPSLEQPSLDVPSLDVPSLDAPLLEASADDVVSLASPTLDDEATAPIDLASVMGAVPSISSIDSSEAMPAPSAHVAAPRAATPARPAALLLDERTGLAGLVNDAPAPSSGIPHVAAALVPAAERASFAADREAVLEPAAVVPSIVESAVEPPKPPVVAATPTAPASPRATSTDERLLGLDMLLGGHSDGPSDVAPEPPATQEVSARDADWLAFLDESPDITSTPLMPEPEPSSKPAEFPPSPDTLLDANGHSSDEITSSSPPEPAVLVDAPPGAGVVPEDGPLGDALEAPTPTMITRLNPDELRALAARLVAKGALTRDDYERAKNKKASRDDEDGRS